jgi:stage V sporulation protein B
MRKQSFERGTFTLTVAALITRIISFAYGIIVARFLGAEGVGLLMMAHPLVPLVITLTSLGLPVAISKLVSEAEARGDTKKIKTILAVSLAVTGTLSVVLTLFSLAGSKWIASFLLTDQRAYYAMLALTPIAPLVAVSAVLKGYFRGKQNMQPLAFSEIFEQIVQVLGLYALVQLLLPYGLEYAVAGAMGSQVIAEAFSLLYLYLVYKRSIRREPAAAGLRVSIFEHIRKGKQTLLELMKIGLPTMGNGVIHSIYGSFQPLLITKSLALFGVSTAMATKQLGLLAGYAFPLLFLPSFITNSLSTALIPAISEAKAMDNNRLMVRRIDQAIRIGLLIGAPSTVVLYFWAEPLTALLYKAPEAAPLLMMLAPIFLLHYFEHPLHAILIGLGKAGTAMWNSVVPTVLKAAAIFILGSEFGMPGVIWSINFSIILHTIMNIMSISRLIGFNIELRMFAKVAFSTVVMTLFGLSTYRFLQNTGSGLAASVILSISLAIAAYLVALLSTNAIRRRGLLKLLKTMPVPRSRIG